MSTQTDWINVWQTSWANTPPKISITSTTGGTNISTPLIHTNDKDFDEIKESLDKINKRLALLERDIELEKRWIELRELGERYAALEKELLEKEQVWDELKK